MYQNERPFSGAKGIRTPDLLIANETRYQLRQCPNNAVTLPHPGNPRHGRDSVDKDLVSSGLFRLLGDVIKGCAHVLDHRLDV